jgi:hypothetical protein
MITRFFFFLIAFITLAAVFSGVRNDIEIKL